MFLMDSSVAPTESSSSWSYDVFLSFRGEDTRFNFTSHLDMALRQKGVNFFIDDKLDRGSQISESLLKSIEGSMISIIVFSENYATSTWCLDEVVKIIECMKSKGQLVLPVFYKVDPSEVRKQTGRFGEEMLKHEAKFMSTKIQTWKEALTIAAGLPGWNLATYRKEADLIQNLVKEVLSKVNRTQLLDLAKHPVGIDSQLRAIELASHVVSNGVYMVGLYGMGGIGKTTLAKALYNKIAHQFEGCSFLSNVREASEQFNGLVQLQENLLDAVLKDNLKVDNVYRGINIIRNRLCSKKVLIVLDDVDKLDQLEKLVGGRDWFGPGSKIIVTTRNKQLLCSHGFDKMHDIQGLDKDKALELFSWHAFKESHPSIDYLDLSKRAISYCKGLPLALVVLGSFLCNRDQSKWISILDEFENSLAKDIEDVLQISFDGLEDKVKDIFLDISCFFVGFDADYVKDMLEACDLNPDYGITILMDLSLLTIEDGLLKMHDLIQQMGQTIVCHESSEPEKRSRLWMAEEIINMLEENSVTDAIKVIELDLLYYYHCHPEKWVPIDPKAFRNMKNLRLLILRNTMFSRSIFDYLPNKLKGIYCRELIIRPEMRNMHDAKHLGNKYENCKRLKHVHLSCSNLEDIPDFSTALNLEKLYIRGMLWLKMIHESVGSLSKLIILDLADCTRLENLPSYFKLKSLEVLNLTGCRKLEEIPDLSASSNLKELDLRGCSNLRIIHDSVGSLSKLITLDLTDCTHLENLPSYFMLKSLEVLNLSGCRKLEKIPDLSASSNLKEVYLRGCSNLRIIHESVGSLSKLISLDLEYCDNLENFPIYFVSKSLEVLNLTGCQKIEEIPDLSIASNLKQLFLKDCSNLRIIHESTGRSLDKLISLDLSHGGNLERLPSYVVSESLEILNLAYCLKIENFSYVSIEKFPGDFKLKHPKVSKLCDLKNLEEMIDFSIASNLKTLDLQGCINLRTVHESIGSLDKLVTLNLGFCSSLEKLPAYIRLKSIEVLNLKNCEKLEQLPKFDENMKSLREMRLDETSIKELPPTIGYLIGLEILSLQGCTNLIALPSEIHLLKSLKKLDLCGCSKLDMFPQRSSFNYPQESLCSKLIVLNLENCNLSNADFLETLSNVSTSLCELNLSGNKFSYLPSLQNFTSLQYLQLRNCKSLRNIANLPTNCLERVDAGGCELLVISPDYIADDFFDGRSRERELIIVMNSEIQNYFNNQTTKSSVRFRIQHNPNKEQVFVICVVFEVEADSCEAEAFISYRTWVDYDSQDRTYRNHFGGSKSEYMWLIRTTRPLRFFPLYVEDRHNIKVRFFVNNNGTVSIRSHGVYVMEQHQLHAIQTVTHHVTEVVWDNDVTEEKEETETDSRKRKRDQNTQRQTCG